MGGLSNELKREVEAVAARIADAYKEMPTVHAEAIEVFQQALVRRRVAEGPAKAPAKVGRTKRKPQEPWPCPELTDTWFLDRGDGVQSFDEYCDEYEGPRSMKDLAIYCIAYLQTNDRVPLITFSHILAGFKRRRWPVEPKNLQNALYGLAAKREKRLLEPPREGQSIRLTPRGLSRAEEVRHKDGDGEKG